MIKFDVIIIGAGASGLLSAKLLSSAGLSVAVMEAQNRVGGRVLSVENIFSGIAEGGAEFIHGKMPLTSKMIKDYRLTAIKRKGKIIRVIKGDPEKENDFISDSKVLEEQLKKVKDDISIAEFISAFLSDKKHERVRNSLKQFVEGYDAADISIASTLAFKEEWLKGDEEQYVVKEGYHSLMRCLHESCCEQDVKFFLNMSVTNIEWQKDNVKILSGSTSFFCEKVIITVPPPLIMRNAITFNPPVDEYIKEMKGLGFGSVIKILLEFDSPFWKEQKLNDQSLSDLGWLFSNETIPTWWTQYPDDRNILTGWLGGPIVADYREASDKFIINKALQALSSIFRMPINSLQALCIVSAVFNWQNNLYAHCAYSYETLNSQRAKIILREPVDATIFFAGEALSMSNTGTVEAAFESAVKVCERLVISHRIAQ